MTTKQQAILEMAKHSPEVRAIVELLMEVGRVDEKTALLVCRAKMPAVAGKVAAVVGDSPLISSMRRAPVMSDHEVLKMLGEFVKIVNGALETAVGDLSN